METVEKLKKVMKEHGEIPWPGLGKNGKLWRELDAFRFGMQKERPWDKRVFMPHPLWIKFLFKVAVKIDVKLNSDNLVPVSEELFEIYWTTILPLAHILEAVSAWRPGQDVAFFDPDVADQMKRKNVFKKLPAEILMAFPSWAVWFPCEISTHNDDYDGFFAQMTIATKKPSIAMTFMKFLEAENVAAKCAEIERRHGANGAYRLKYPTTQQKYIIPIDDCSLDESVERFNEAADPVLPAATQIVDDGITRALNMVTYVCARGLANNKKYLPGSHFTADAIGQDKRRDRLFPAQSPKIWKVGEMDGEAMRECKRRVGEYEKKTGRIVSPHMRHGFFEGFWTGPRKEPEKRKLVVHFIAPTMVRGNMDFSDYDGAADDGVMIGRKISSRP